jgi:hypothetical protein
MQCKALQTKGLLATMALTAVWLENRNLRNEVAIYTSVVRNQLRHRPVSRLWKVVPRIFFLFLTNWIETIESNQVSKSDDGDRKILWLIGVFRSLLTILGTKPRPVWKP